MSKPVKQPHIPPMEEIERRKKERIFSAWREEILEHPLYRRSLSSKSPHYLGRIPLYMIFLLLQFILWVPVYLFVHHDLILIVIAAISIIFYLLWFITGTWLSYLDFQ